MRRRPKQSSPTDAAWKDIEVQKKACPICGVPLARWVAWSLLLGTCLYALYYSYSLSAWKEEAKEVAQETAEHLCKLLSANWSLVSTREGIDRTAAFLMKLAPGRLERSDMEHVHEIRHTHDSYDTLKRNVPDQTDLNAEILYRFLMEETGTHLGPRSKCIATSSTEDRLSDRLGYYSDAAIVALTRNNASGRNTAYRMTGKLRDVERSGTLLFEMRLHWK